MSDEEQRPGPDQPFVENEHHSFGVTAPDTAVEPGAISPGQPDLRAGEESSSDAVAADDAERQDMNSQVEPASDSSSEAQRLREEAASAEGSFTRRVKEARADELEAAGALGEVATQIPVTDANADVLSEDPKENPNLAQEMAELQSPAEILMANIRKTDSISEQGALLDLLEKKSQELAEIGLENYLGERGRERRQEREDRETYRQAREYVVSKIVAAPKSFDLTHSGVMELVDLSLIGIEGGRTQIGRDEYDVTPVFGYEITREQTYRLRQEIYEMLGAQLPELDSLRYEEEILGGVFNKKTASVETQTTFNGISLEEIRTNWYKAGDPSGDQVVLLLKKVTEPQKLDSEAEHQETAETSA